MEKIASTNQEKTGSSSDHDGVDSSFFKGVCGKLKSKVVEFAEETKKIGEDDPRRIVHSVKVGIAITLVSLLYYLRPLYDGFVGEAGMWAIITVVVVSEFTVGGTLSRGINRGVATLVAGGLGVGAKYLTDLFGSEGEPIALGVLVFVLAVASTYMRFRPNIKKKYDYGVLIFMLTFSLIAISGYRVTNILEMGYHRLITILIGGAVIVLVSVTVFPVWAGQDLHNLVAANIDNLATLFFQGYGGHEIRTSPIDDDDDESYLECHKSVLGSKATEESLANFAWWEPCHGRFRFSHPWKHYLKIGDLTRECANHIQTLIGIGCCMNSKHQASSEKASSSEFRLKIEPACKTLSTELGKAMKELATAMKEMTSPSSSAAEIHIKNSKSIADDLKTVLREWSSSSKLLDLEGMMPLLVTASVLIDVIDCVERISVSLDELSQKARFRQPADSTTSDRAIVKLDDQHVVIEIKEEDLRDALDNKKPIYIYFT